MKKLQFFFLSQIILALLLSLFLVAIPWGWLTLSSAKTRIPNSQTSNLWRVLDTPFNNELGQILEDKEGNIWVASEPVPGEGLAKFKQGRWLTYTLESTQGALPSNSIYSARFDRKGNLWVTFAAKRQESDTGYIVEPANTGVTRFNGREWHTFTFTNTDGGLVSNQVWYIFEDEKDNLWFVAQGGLSRYDGQTWTVVANKNDLKTEILGGRVFQDSQNRLWMGLSGFDKNTLIGRGVARSDPVGSDGKAINWQIFTKINSGLSSDLVFSIAEDTSGDIWFGTDEGVSRFDGGKWQSFKAENSNLPGNLVYKVIDGYDDGEIWVGTDRGTAGFIGGQWQRFGSFTPVWSILKDSEQLVWFSGIDGVHYHTAYYRQNFGVVRDFFAARDGTMWAAVGTGGISRYKNGVWQSFSETNGDLNSDDVQDLLEARDGAIWVGTWGGGISRYQSGRWQHYNVENDYLHSNDVSVNLLEADDGAIWIGTRDGGISRYKTGQWQTFDVENSNLKSNSIKDLIQTADKAIWVGTWGGGVSRYQNDQWETFNIENGDLHSNYVQILVEDNDEAIWVGTWGGGISRYKANKWQTFDVKSGDLSNNKVRNGFEASDKAIWIETDDNKFSRYQKEEWDTFTREEYDTLKIQLLNPSFPEPIIDYNGFVWTVTTTGLVRTHPGGYRPPWVSFTTVNNVPISISTHTLTYGERQRVSIDFTGDDLATRPENLRYFYKLENSPVYTDWQVATYNEPIFFEELPPGQHTLLLKAIDEDGNESEPARLDITVENPPQVREISVEPRYAIPGLNISFTLPQLLGGGIGGGLLFVLVAFGVTTWRKQQQIRQNVINKLNPYIAGDPIDNPELFFGREELIATIMRSLPGNHIAVEGPRRSGKTSLLNEIARRLRQLDDPQFCFVPVKFNCQSATQTEFFYKLMRALFKTLKEMYPNLAWPPLIHQRAETYSDFDFEDDLHSLLATLRVEVKKEIKIILLLDEGDTLNQYDLAMQGKIRTLISDNKTLKMVWVGTSIMKAAKDLGSPWYNLQITHPLLPLPPIEAHRLIIEPAERLGYTYQVEATERILAYSNGQPYIIQYLCHRAVETMLENERATITLADVETAISQLEAEKSAQDTASVVYQVRAQAEGQLSLAETSTPYENDPEDDVP